MKTKSDRGLRLYEEIALLAFHDEKGTTSTEYFGYAISSAILAELLFDGCIEIGKSKKPLVFVAQDTKYGDAIIDEAISRICTAKRNASIQTWVNRIAATKKLKQKVARGLCEKGILQETPGKFLLVFNRTLYPEIDSAPETLIVERLEKAIFTDDEVDERTAVVISVANAVGLLGVVFDKKRLKSRKKRIERISNGELVGKTLREVIEVIQTAMVVAVMVPAVTAAISS